MRQLIVKQIFNNLISTMLSHFVAITHILSQNHSQFVAKSLTFCRKTSHILSQSTHILSQIPLEKFKSYIFLNINLKREI